MDSILEGTPYALLVDVTIVPLAASSAIGLHEQAGGGGGPLNTAVIVSASLCKCVVISMALVCMLGGLLNIIKWFVNIAFVVFFVKVINVLHIIHKSQLKFVFLFVYFL